MSIWAPEEVIADKASQSEVVVNVFAASKNAIIQMSLGQENKWVTMECIVRKDPYFEEMIDWENEHNIQRVDWSVEAVNSGHIWHANLPNKVSKGLQFIHIKVTDMFGQVFTAKRVIDIK